MPKRTRRKSSSRTTRKTSPVPDPAASDISDSELDAFNNPDENDEALVEVPVVESLVAGRQKRSTAGNRLATLLDKEASKDDELELLFAEAEDDIEFEAEDDEGGLSDVQLESSDEDEAEGGEGGEGGAEGQEDLSGERELQAEARAEKAKKRKAPETLFKPPRNTAVPKKKVTIVEADLENVTTIVSGQLAPSEAALNKHRKKSERISWIPTEGPTRTSSRKLSVKNREVTHHRLKESEARRLHTIALMEAAAKKKEKENPKREMTQAERLEEAKKTEAMNKKSLNKWEQSEAARAEQQRLKLAALHSRNLNGAVIRWWSGQAEWDEKGRLVRVGKKLIEEVQEVKEKEKEKKKGGRPRGKSQKNVQDHQEPEKRASGQTTEDEVEGKSIELLSATRPNAQQQQPVQPPLDVELPRSRQMPSMTDLTTNLQPKPHALPPTFNTNTPLLDGILYYASLPEDPSKQAQTTKPAEHALPPPPKPEYSTRNLVILQNFEDSQVQTRESLTRTLFPNHTVKRESTLCTLPCILSLLLMCLSYVI
ncbi:YL1 nuclear protein-domain-containing protein [Tirmania nivea]|nr:YL1 nuclear protein-domain-containing protein [Tirmania nivea]